MSLRRPARRAPARYRPFPNLAYRNCIQQRFEVPTLARLLRLPPGRRVLEVGCGRGVALPALARACRPALLVGLDVEPALLVQAAHELARERVAARLVCADVREMPFEDGSFDVVVDFGTCYHIDRPDLALAEVARVLAPGGVFAHETPLGQIFAHPVRSLGRALPWAAAPSLIRARHAGLWASETRRSQ